MEEMNKLLAKRWVFRPPQTQRLSRDLLPLTIKVQPLASPRAHCHLGSAKQGTVSQFPVSRAQPEASSPDTSSQLSAPPRLLD